MTHGTLPQSTLDAINARLPDVSTLSHRAHSFRTDMLSMQSTDLVPTAATYFHDCADTLREVWYGLHEYETHRVFYREVAGPPDVVTATFYERFYLGAAASRLYAACEQLADAALAMFNVRPEELRELKELKESKKFTKSIKKGRFSVVGAYLRECHASDQITKHAVEFTKCLAWHAAMRFRGRMVHEQPPQFVGGSLGYPRGILWKHSRDKTKSHLPITFGTEGSEDTSVVGGDLIAATSAFVTLVDKILDEYERKLEPYGIKRTPARWYIDRRLKNAE